MVLFMTADKLVFLTLRLHYIWENIGFFLLCWLGISLLCVILAYWLLKKCRPKTLKIIGFNLLLFIFLLNTFFFLAETYFRFIFDYSDPFAYLQSSQRWLQRHVVYNADAFRDRDFSTTKNPGTVRIAILGDSFAFGWGVNKVEDRFSNLLEKKLNQASGSKFEVYNTAVTGWESKEELRFLQEKAGMFNFDIIVLAYVFNDIYQDRAFDFPFLNPEIVNLKNHSLMKPLAEKSFFLEFILSKLLNTITVLHSDVIQKELLLYHDPQTWQNHQRTLKGIIDYCRQHHQRLIIVIFPYLDLVDRQPYPAQFVHQKLNQFFQEQGVETIDLYPLLKKYPVKKLKVNPFDSHPSTFVHQKVADWLYQKLQSK